MNGKWHLIIQCFIWTDYCNRETFPCLHAMYYFVTYLNLTIVQKGGRDEREQGMELWWIIF